MSVFTSRRRLIAAGGIAAAASLLSIGAATAPALAQLNVAPATQNTVITYINTDGTPYQGGFQVKSGSQGEVDAFATNTDPSGRVGDAGANATVVVGAGNKTETFHATVAQDGFIYVPSVNWSPNQIAKSGEITVSVTAHGDFSAATASVPYELV